MQSLIRAFNSALSQTPSAGQDVVLVADPCVCGAALTEMLTRQTQLRFRVVPVPRSLPGVELLPEDGVLLVAVQPNDVDLLPVVQGFADTFLDIPVVVVGPSLDEGDEARFILAGAAECHAVEELSSQGLVRCLLRAILRRRRRALEGAKSHKLLKEIEQRRRTENQLRAAKDAAEMADRAKTEFLANMSHELRTPLNAIIGFSEVMSTELMGPLGNETYLGYVRDILSSGQHLLEVINEILDMSKIEAGQVELYPAPLRLFELVPNVLRLMRERAEGGQVLLLSEVPDNLPPVLVDERRFKQILLNLLSNAIKFTARQGQVRIWARHEADGGISLGVSDSGVGMDADGVAKALTPFGQVDSSLSRRHEGTGLGLPLAKSFTELHGGHLELSSLPGQGTTVTIRIPAARVLAQDS